MNAVEICQIKSKNVDAHRLLSEKIKKFYEEYWLLTIIIGF